MKLKFTVSERLSFSILFLEKNDITINRLIDDIEDKIRLSMDEMNEINLKVIKSKQGKDYTWDDSLADKVNSRYEANFTEVEIRFLKGRVCELNEAKEIPRLFSPACEKIMDSKAEIPVDKTSENNKKKSPEEVSENK